jgi:hypothetical protein
MHGQTMQKLEHFEDENGVSIGNQDIDSDPDNNNTNDAGGQPESPADDYVRW